MATFVLVHGAWSGGWCWRAIGGQLRAAGHDVFTPTFTGQGERYHLADPDVGLETHVRDLCNVFEFERLADVVLVAHSYGGTVATMAAEELRGRISRLVHLDGFVPEDGQATFDFFPPDLRDGLRAAARDGGDGWQIPVGADLLDIWGLTDPALRAWIAPLLRPFPLRCFEEPVTLATRAAAQIPTTYVASTEGPIGGLFAVFADRARRQGWDDRELAAGHAAWAAVPDTIAELLLPLAEATPRR